MDQERDAQQVFLDRVEQVQQEAEKDGEELSYRDAMNLASQRFPMERNAYLRAVGVLEMAMGAEE